MANVRLNAPNTEELELVCLSLDGDGYVLWGNAIGRALGRAQHPEAHFLTDLVHPDDELVANDLIDEAKREGCAQRILRLRDAESEPRFLHLKVATRREEPFPGEISSQGSEHNLVAQGWDVTELMLRQRELEMQARLFVAAV